LEGTSLIATGIDVTRLPALVDWPAGGTRLAQMIHGTSGPGGDVVEGCAMRCRDVMKKVVVFCHEDDLVGECARLMQESNIGFLPVIDGQGQVSGVVTDRDLALRVVSESSACRTWPRSIRAPAPATSSTRSPSANRKDRCGLCRTGERAGRGLATAGQPSAEALRRLKEWGFKTVVNLRPPAEGTEAEEAMVRGLDLRYVSVPVRPATFSLTDVAAVVSVLDDPRAAPVLLHCSSANRVGAVWMALQVQKGKSREQAEKEARAIGLSSSAMVEAVARVLDQSPPGR
jgi:uncharacterized protein (TIGR01244 family)